MTQSPGPAEDRPAGQGPARRQNPRSRSAILRSTVELLGEGGYRRLTMEGVAAHAGVGKATVYRWWPTKASLVVDALREHLPLNPIRETGDTHADLRTAIKATIGTLTVVPMSGTIPALAADLLHEPGAAARFREFIQPRRASVVRILRHAADRGELPAGLDAELLFDIYAGTVYYRALVSGEPVTGELVEQLADLLLNARVPRKDRRAAEAGEPPPAVTHGS